MPFGDNLSAARATRGITFIHPVSQSRLTSLHRTLYAVNQLDVFWYDTLSQPRLISHLEIKHDLPCSEQTWSCATSTQWAHQTLTRQSSGPPTKYVKTIQDCLSPDSTFDVSALEPYGALIIILFLLSSARELSGWTTMTGRLCFERFDALNASLLAFEPLVEKFSDDDPMAVLMKSTWHMVMIELLHWSHTHTNGVVEVSLDAAFAAAWVLYIMTLPSSIITDGSQHSSQHVSGDLTFCRSHRFFGTTHQLFPAASQSRTECLR